MVKASASERGNHREVQLRFCFFTQLVEDAVFGEFGFGPLSAVIVADEGGQAVELQKLTVLFDDFPRVERRAGGPDRVENHAIIEVIQMGYRQSKCVVSAARRVDETKILADVR